MPSYNLFELVTALLRRTWFDSVSHRAQGACANLKRARARARACQCSETRRASPTRSPEHRDSVATIRRFSQTDTILLRCYLHRPARCCAYYEPEDHHDGDSPVTVAASGPESWRHVRLFMLKEKQSIPHFRALGQSGAPMIRPTPSPSQLRLESAPDEDYLFSAWRLTRENPIKE